MRTLTVTSPPERGPDVTALQVLLGVTPADGVYGIQTATAAYRAKIRLGYAHPDHSAGDELEAYLTGKRKPTAAMRKRGGKQPKVGPTPSPAPTPPTSHEEIVRAACVSVAQLLLANAARIHYPPNDQRTTGSIHEISSLASLQNILGSAGGLTADCSQTVSLIAHVAGARCPDGEYAKDWAADGYTGTLLAGCEHITAGQVKPGDLHVYGAGTGHHVAMALSAGPNPEMVSHGSDPIRLVRDSDESRYQPAGGAWLRLPT